MRTHLIPPVLKFAVLILASGLAAQVRASIIFDDFNVNEGHFNQAPGFSGSTIGEDASSSADRVTTDGPREGPGHQRLVFVAATPGNVMRIRHLSGVGNAANNTAFTTSSGEDGWIGVYLKADPTTDTNWTVQIWIEGASNNGGIEKPIIADGEWHLYEWNLDDDTGGPDGWGTISGILSGTAVVSDGSHTIDSVIFRNSTGPATSTFFMDFVAKSDSGSVSNLLSDPCLSTPGVLITGPIAMNLDTIRVIGVSSNATAVTVYQNSGSGGALVPVGSKTSGITEGDNDVTVSGLVEAAAVLATQTIDAQESCMLPTTFKFVGGGANPSVRLALSIRESSGTGPVGEPNPDNPQSANLHFLGATALAGGAPVNAPVIYPSNDWQTVTFYRGPILTIGDPASVDGAIVNGSGYAANDYVTVQLYAYRQIPQNNSKVFSQFPAPSQYLTSNDVFRVNWTWPAVAEADGYRLVRSLNFLSFDEYVDVTSTSFMDDNTGWSTNAVITPTASQVGASVKWNSASGDPNPVGTTNAIPGDWGILEALAFVIHEADTGPFDIYIDSIENAGNVFQTFDTSEVGTSTNGFQPPNFSGSTDSGLLSQPIIGEVSNNIADTGANSYRASWQWNGTNASKWLRLTTAGVGNPMVNLSEPITFKLLMLPVGSAPPGEPQELSATLSGTDVILDWTGTAYLQAADAVTGPYNDIAGPITGPFTNAITGDRKFFRLRL